MLTFHPQGLVICLIAFLGSCTTVSPDYAAAKNPCARPDSNECLIQLVRSSLQNLSDHAGYVVGSSELVVALGQKHKVLSEEVMQEAQERVGKITDSAVRADALVKLADASVDAAIPAMSSRLVQEARESVLTIDDENKRWDIAGRLSAVIARLGRESDALELADSMPQSSDYLASLKARTYHDLAPVFARQQNFPLALKTLESATMGLVYYRAAARTDVATLAYNAERADLVSPLLNDAERLTSNQTDGYFIAGVLRHIAASYETMEHHSNAERFFTRAVSAARLTEVTQKRARALSRVATAQSDFARYSDARNVLLEAMDVASEETNPMLQRWCYYEIAGSAAFAGAFDLAEQAAAFIPEDFKISGKSLYAATQRDIAWGLARHQKMELALEKASNINSLRERAQAYARIIRIKNNASMRALPRYL